jgi:hypothetical protein
MAEYFKATENPVLIQQCELLQAHARSGREAQALDDVALAFETHQARLCSTDGTDALKTEKLPDFASENPEEQVG